jgi:hypothetical protein
MAFPKKYNTVIINALLALVVCLVINFSYLLAIREQDRRIYEATQWIREVESQPSITGTLHVHKDGYGYILYTAAGQPVADSLYAVADSLATAPPLFDSIYISPREINRLSLADQDLLRVVVGEARNPAAHPLMTRVLEVNGAPFDYGERFDHPSEGREMVLQIVFYLLYAFILLTVMTLGATNNASIGFYLRRAAYCLVIAVVLWFLMPVVQPRSEHIAIMALVLRDGFFPVNIMVIMIMKCSFALAFALLYGRTFQLIWQREGIMLENEQLKSENLRARYNTLVGQINPHFLFNSLNSLQALVREGKEDDAVRYIDRLSDTFRYTIRHDPDSTTTLGEELEFVTAYGYLLEVRYAEKLFIDIDVEPEKLGWRLPTFSIQPLVENAVKHNVITRARPLHISIRTSGDLLVVSNPISPKIDPEKGTGIGLANLSNRWQLLTGQGIEVRDDGKTFSVSLPFIK